MRRKSILFICVFLLAIVICACGAKDKGPKSGEEVNSFDETTQEAKSTPDLETATKSITSPSASVTDTAEQATITKNAAQALAMQEIDDATNTTEDKSVIYLSIDSLECFRWDGPVHLYIEGHDGTIYHLYDETVLTDGIPCNDDVCDPLIWASRYINHCSVTDESDPNDPYYCLGFSGADIWKIRVDENNNIKAVMDIVAVD